MRHHLLKIVIPFAYSGFSKAPKREALFWKILAIARKFDDRPIVVLNADTADRGDADPFLSDARNRPDELEVIRVWSVDTCQMWLAGWGHVLDNYKEAAHIVQIPGDLDLVANEHDFINNLKNFITHTASDIAIGDFKISDRFGAKMLIDEYGTYPLLCNWFPELTQAIFKLPLYRPRSEFLNLKADTLRILLQSRKFAYEQTINFLIGAWDFEKSDWKYDITAFQLGEIEDDRSQRQQYMAALDQIERTERLLKLRWREIYKHTNFADFNRIFNQKDRGTTSIREAAGTIIQNLLGLNS